MGERSRRMIMVFLLVGISVFSAEGQTQLDVCSSCHANATCEDKPDGSGKVCNCKYGFVGNGRTFCQDKDECQIGANKICGLHTTCHNTYGSYYCTCLSGYSPSNSMNVFIPNDGTHCQDVNECMITGLCGEGGQCRNTEGSFDCSCQLGYRIHNGAEPFHPQRDQASCKEVDCGPPAAGEDTAVLSVSGTTYGSVVTFTCDEGFVWRRGDNRSVCGADGIWRGATLVCEEILCGNPPLIEFTEQGWNHDSAPGSVVVYVCKNGFYSKGGSNESICNKNGLWTPVTLSCQEMLCGGPPAVLHTVQVWTGSSTPGSTVAYFCKTGFYHHGGRNVSVCTPNGYWTQPDILCKEVDCGEPLPIPHSAMLWDKRSTLGSQVVYKCDHGFASVGEGNRSVCAANGEWVRASLSCQAKCGPIPILANSEVVWHNRSVVIHRCAAGYRSWRGSNVSVCGSSGEWRRASLRCIKMLPPISDLVVFNENCLQWKAGKYEEDTEVYKVTYVGIRDYQRTFQDKGKHFLRSKSDQLTLCLQLLPVTNYSISVTAASARFMAAITTNTSLTEPPAPIVFYTEFETPNPTLRLQRSPNTLDPLSLYQIFVLPVEGIMEFDCSSPTSLDLATKLKPPAEYITAQLHVQSVGLNLDFTIGDGVLYGGFYNEPLESGRTYYIIIRAVSQWKTDSKSCCVLWAKVAGASYILRASLLSAAAFIGLVAMVILAGYSFIWCTKRT